MDIDLSHLKEPCVCGKKHDFAVREIYIESGAVKRLGDILQEFQNPAFICDSNTRAAAEPFLEEEFKDYPVIELNPQGLRADNVSVEKVLKQLDFCDRGCSAVPVDILVAIGTGTIHELTRYCAVEYGIPFVSVPTAASGDSFATAVAAITWDGMKKTFPAVAPEWILADTDIFSKAPYRLTAAGISDLMGTYIALIDWKVANLLTGEYICPEICNLQEEMIKNTERELDDIRDRDTESMEKLMYALILSGLHMQMACTSRPISGAAHHVAHLLDMETADYDQTLLHGEKVLAGLMLVLKEYKKLEESIRAGKAKVQNETMKGLEYGLLEKEFGTGSLFEEVIAENTPNPLEDLDLELLEESLDQIGELIDDLPEPEHLMKKLKKAGCLSALPKLNIGEERKREILYLSPYVRRTLTLLRLMKLIEIK